MKLGLAITILFLSVGLGVGLYLNYDRPLPTAMPVLQSSVSMSVGGLDLKNFSQGKLAERIQVGQFMVKPRRFGIFSVKSVNEAIFLKTRIDLHPRPCLDGKDGGKDTGLLSAIDNSLQSVAQMRGVGRVTRSKFTEFMMRLHREGEPPLQIHAREAFGNIPEKEFSLSECILQVGEKRLKASKALWNQERKCFIVPGEFVFWQGATRLSGTGAEVDLSLGLRVVGSLASRSGPRHAG